MSVPGLEHLPGTTLPEGEFTITKDENRELAAALGGPEPEGDLAHPAWAYIATQRGIGISVEGICRLADFDVAEGPMLGSTHFELSAPLRVDTGYAVAGEVLDIVRKEGRKAGVFDMLSFRERLVDAAGEQAVATTNTFILPRRGL